MPGRMTTISGVPVNIPALWIGVEGPSIGRRLPSLVGVLTMNALRGHTCRVCSAPTSGGLRCLSRPVTTDWLRALRSPWVVTPSTMVASVTTICFHWSLGLPLQVALS